VSTSSVNRALKRWPGWLVLLFMAVLVVALAASRTDGVATPAERAETLERRLACPICDGESVYESRASISLAMLPHKVFDRMSEPNFAPPRHVRCNDSYISLFAYYGLQGRDDDACVHLFACYTIYLCARLFIYD
jgi:hypothetical protein